MDLGDGIDVNLSDAWGRQEQAILDFGTHEPVNRPPSVYLGRPRLTFRPEPRLLSTTPTCTLISVRKALKLLAVPRKDAKPAFLVTVKEINPDSAAVRTSKAPGVSSQHESELKEILNSY